MRMNHEAHKGKIVRSQWASKMGFILATAGAAVGLGNLWKFPYLMGRNGGFPFLVAYLIFVLALGLPVMITEMSIGRLTQKNPVNAYHAINRKTTFIGVMGVLSAFIILSYYSVIGGFSNISRPMQLPFQRRLIFRHTLPSRSNRLYGILYLWL